MHYIITALGCKVNQYEARRRSKRCCTRTDLRPQGREIRST